MVKVNQSIKYGIAVLICVSLFLHWSLWQSRQADNSRTLPTESSKIESDITQALGKIIGEKHVFVSVTVNKKMFEEEIEEERTNEASKNSEEMSDEEFDFLPGLFDDLKNTVLPEELLDDGGLESDATAEDPKKEDEPGYKKSKKNISPNTIENITVSVMIDKDKKAQLKLNTRQIEKLVKTISNFQKSRNDQVYITYVSFGSWWGSLMQLLVEYKKEFSVGTVTILLIIGGLVFRRVRQLRAAELERKNREEEALEQENLIKEKLNTLTWDQKRDKLVQLAETQSSTMAMILMDMIDHKE
jgi:flagellar biosynthesis/type III secretory pathway M-ring protein FliF/YscJ